VGLFRFSSICMYFLYIFYSAKLDKYYVGSTAKITERINKHNKIIKALQVPLMIGF
jgi:predicted GIY-YIG superfamily endonuclease